MVLSTQKERVHTLLRDTITLLCKNGLSFDTEFSIEALIGITLDKQDVFLVNINEIILSEAAQKQAALDKELENKRKYANDNYSSSDSGSCSGSQNSNRRRKKLKRKFDIKRERRDDEDSNVEDFRNNGEETEAHTAEGRGHTDTHSSEVGDPPALPHSFVKRDIEEEEDSMDDDIIVIKEEVGEDWTQFCEPNAFPATSDSQNSQAPPNFLSSLSSLGQSQDLSSSYNMGWSPGAAPGLLSPGPSGSSPAGGMSGSVAGDSNQQMKGIYTCPICKKTVSGKSYMTDHMKHHQGHYRYHCDICKKGFASTTMLKGHMSWHTGVKEYKCKLCAKEFRYPQDVRRHMRQQHLASSP